MEVLDPEVRFALLRLTCVPEVGPAAQARVIAAWRGGKLALPGFFELTAAEYRARYRLRPAAVAALTAGREEIRRTARALEREMAEREIELVAEEGLPAAFPLLFAHGNLELRDEPAATLLASSDASERALEVGEQVADALACAGVHLVSGHNRPLYKAAGVAARRRGAPLTLVLDRGLLRAWGEDWGREPLAPARVWEERFDREASLALSPFRLQDAWVTANARRRDQLVCGSARALLAVSVRPGGWLAAQCRAALARGATVLLCGGVERDGWRRADLELEGARVVAPEGAAEAVLEALGTPGAGRRRAEEQRQAAFVRALVAAAGGGEGAEVRDLLAVEAPATFAYAAPRGRREPPAGVILAGASPGEDPERAVITWLGGLRPGGLLAALLPASFLTEAGAAGFRGRLLAQGELLAAIALPGERGVCLIRKRGAETASDASRPALLVAPAAPLETPGARRRYLEEALARARAALAGSLNRPGSAAPASSPPPTAAGEPSPG
jgi:predicted Rossmann fold nucleotide-binding protein DprA/Smf involved in DNA uptake